MKKESVSDEKVETSGDSASLLKVPQLVGWWKKFMELLWFCISNVFLTYIQEVFKHGIDGKGSEGSPPQQSSSPPPLAPGSTGLTHKFQTVKNGAQTNLDKGSVKMGNIRPGASFNPAAMTASIEFQTAEKGIQQNENSGDFDLWNWG